MSDVVVKSVSDLAYYQGPHAIAGIKFRQAAKDLGVSAWGMNVLEIEAGCSLHPEHDHVSDGQEEVYVVLKGSATLHTSEKDWPLEAGAMVRVGPETKRKIIPGPDGVTVLALGAAAGKAYSPRR